jgi:hypothetical protein
LPRLSFIGIEVLEFQRIRLWLDALGQSLAVELVMETPSVLSLARDEMRRFLSSATGSFQLNLRVKPVELNPRISGFELPVDLLASIVSVIVPDSQALA